ncbi:hypothetical protein HGM15179_005862 [Zosterops borbonicus]|uniref:Uncharacterized protein n=1 Tax=Zosterops borbonicus TaxID=364589 RepID=A0A8K1GNK5_9PASS|nr:hypothetical protein HGM15179_005862 [Zosterops borbonicus]
MPAGKSSPWLQQVAAVWPNMDYTSQQAPRPEMGQELESFTAVESIGLEKTFEIQVHRRILLKCHIHTFVERFQGW